MSNANFTSVLPTPAERTLEAAMVTVKKIPGRLGDFGVVALENIPAHTRIMVYPGKWGGSNRETRCLKNACPRGCRAMSRVKKMSVEM